MARGSLPQHNRHRTRRRYPQFYRLNIPIPFLSRQQRQRYFTISIPTSLNGLSLSLVLQSIADIFLYILGPFLIIVVFALLCGLSYTFFFVIIPLISPNGHFTFYAMLHESFVLFILVNILFNYVLCVMTRNAFPIEKYNRVVKELAEATGFDYPETKEDVERWRSNYRNMILGRSREMRKRDEQDHEHCGGELMRGKYDLESEGKTKMAPIATDDSTSVAGGSNGNNSVQRRNNNTLQTSTSSPSARNHSVAASTTLSSSNKRENIQTSRPWMLLGAQDWGFCEKSKLPKPPRSHFDYVTKALVLNMDHYCPWMFNVVGYFNYRYFCNFLIYVSTGMIYGAVITFRFFMKVDSAEYYEQISQSRQLIADEHNNTSTGIDQRVLGSHDGISLQNGTGHNHHTTNFHYSQVKHLIPNIPTPIERMPICFSFMMCLAVGCAVTILLGFHIYLIVSGQTTIEFHGNMMKKRMAKERGVVWYNPYNLGWKRNLEQVWGSFSVGRSSNTIDDNFDSHDEAGKSCVNKMLLFLSQSMAFIVLLLPSTREPEFLPVPIKGEMGKRKNQKRNINMKEESADILV